MKKLFKFSILLTSLYFFILIMYFGINSTFAEDINLEEMMKSSPVFAEVIADCEVFLDMEMQKHIKNIEAGTLVEIIKDRGEERYFIKSDKYLVKGWVFAKFLKIPETPKANSERLKSSLIEKYINESGLSSETEYLVFTDIDRQLTYILKGKENNWKLEKTIVCATGKNSSPTTRGMFKTGDRGEWFFSERLGSGAKYWVRFNESYLFHSVAMDKNQNIIDGTLGQRCSSGCVRMSLEDIEWFYKNIPKDTTVFIN